MTHLGARAVHWGRELCRMRLSLQMHCFEVHAEPSGSTLPRRLHEAECGTDCRLQAHTSSMEHTSILLYMYRQRV